MLSDPGLLFSFSEMVTETETLDLAQSDSPILLPVLVAMVEGKPIVERDPEAVAVNRAKKLPAPPVRVPATDDAVEFADPYKLIVVVALVSVFNEAAFAPL